MRSSYLAAIVILFCCTLVAAPGCARPSAQQEASASNPTAPSDSASAQQGAYTTLVDHFRNTDLGNGWQPVGSMELQYAHCFTVDYYEGGYGE